MTTNYKPSFTRDDIEILEKQTGFQGYFRIDKYVLRHRLFHGGWGKPIQRELFERRSAAAALLFDPKLNKIVLIEQFRMGPLNQSQHPWLLELVAGLLESNETPEQLVERESMEEAGLKVQAIIPIAEYWVSPGASTEKVNLFCARVDASNAGGVFGLAEEGEDIRVWVFTVEEVYQLLEEGKINNSLTLIAVQWFKLNENKVRALWAE